jgi:hypothetical protein
MRPVTARILRRARPTFLVLGAQKSGTSALHHYLQAHPAVLCACPKEVHYFDNAYLCGDDWYVTHFPSVRHCRAIRRDVGVNAAVGELSPSYLFDPRVPERVRRFDPSLKLIVLLRDPIERAFSQYHMERLRGNESLSFEEAIEREEERIVPELERMLAEPGYVSQTYLRHSYLARGRYAEQLERWLELFPRGQLLILDSRTLRADAAGAMAEISRFLGVAESRAECYPEVAVQAYASALASTTRKWLADYFEPHNQLLYRLLGYDLGWTNPSTVASLTM